MVRELFQKAVEPVTEPRWLRLARIAALERCVAWGTLPPRSSRGPRTLDLSDLETSSPIVDTKWILEVRESSGCALENGLTEVDGVVMVPLLDGVSKYAAHVRPLLCAEPLDMLEPSMALNAALFTIGGLVIIPAGRSVHEQICLVHRQGGVSSDHFRVSRSVIIAEEKARASVLEHFPPGSAGQGAISCTMIRVERDAELEYTLVRDQQTSFIHHAVVVALAEGARFSMLSAEMASHPSESLVEVRCLGQGSQVRVTEVVLSASGDSRNRVFIRHLGRGSTSRTTLASILGEGAMVNFHGHIFVGPMTSKIDAYLLNRNLLLSKNAVVKSEPRLEIHSQDVKCSHGATSGYLDQLSLFYMRTRGIPEPEARRLLVGAFLTSQLNVVSAPELRLGLQSLLEHRLENILVEQRT